ncbi:hypothetical protein LTR10_002742 [Elasticomyces elasticus]|nr:hypothetical protein LTR10_002742 [Elasticomyces elasticus]KAK4967918.1 hypothetical protein LTR42_010246 [Elasticomyces elasticus]
MAASSNAGPDAQPPLYRYTQLSDDEIRVLYLEPARNLEAPIHCRMKTIDLARRKGGEQYRTLSYAWGPTYPDGSHLSDVIYCDDCRIPVTANLLQALRRFRAEFSAPEQDFENSSILIQPLTKWLWIDAISINQLDVAERSQQVSRMADIYRLSKQLEVWLGESAQDLVTQTLEHEIVMMIRNGTWEDRETLPNMAAELLLRRPWFQRRWAYRQESKTDS